MPNPLDDPSTDSKISQCEEALGYQFRDQALIELALTHASVARTRIESNERLEFLGDAILGAIICEILYHRFPEFPEGELTRIKSSLVSRTTCAVVANQLGLSRFLILGKGLLTHQQIPSSILAGVFESVVGAVHLDGGPVAVQAFVERAMATVLEEEAEPQLTQELQESSATDVAETVRRDAAVPRARREGARPFQVLQDLRGDRVAGLRGRLGGQQERGGAACGA